MVATNISLYRVAWNPVARRGEVIFLAGGPTPIRVSLGSADAFTALALMLNERNVIWDGRVLHFESGRTRKHGESDSLLPFDRLGINPEAKRIIDACEDEWPANKSDCSGFVKDVSAAFGIVLSGQANEIVDQLTGPGWTEVPNGELAKQAADDGKLVIGGLKGSDQRTPSSHGHVVVVVSGPLAKDRYPTAYWGTLGGTGARAKTTNWAWKAGDRDKTRFAARSI